MAANLDRPRVQWIHFQRGHQKTISPRFGPNWPHIVSDEKIFHYFSHTLNFYAKIMSADNSHFVWTSGPTDIILKGDHQKTIPLKVPIGQVIT